MVDATLFIPLLIIAVTQIIKMFAPQIAGIATVIVALAVGVIVALLDGPLGVTNISVAQGIVLGLGAVGISALASKAGGGAPGDGTPVVR